MDRVEFAKTLAGALVIAFDPLDPEVVRNPYPFYARLRAEDPVAYLPDYDVWLLTRHADVLQALKDPSRFSSALGMGTSRQRQMSAGTGINYRLSAPGVRLIITTDLPEHTSIRRAVSAAFSAKAIAELAPLVDALAAELVGRFVERGLADEVDFYAEVAEQLPVLLLAHMFGVPQSMHQQFRMWSTVVTSDLDQATGDANQLGRGIGMLRYFRHELQRRRLQPSDDLLGTLVASGEAGLDDREIIAFCGFLLVAGLETTSNLLTNLMDVLVSRDDIQAELRSRPDVVPKVVEEALRFDPPVQALWRQTTEPVDLGEGRLPEGARVLISFAAANRDPAVFRAPDEFQPGRQPADNLAMGQGAHYCLGARLARMEVGSVVRALLDQTSWLAKGSTAERTKSIVLRGFLRQAIRVQP